MVNRSKNPTPALMGRYGGGEGVLCVCAGKEWANGTVSAHCSDTVMRVVACRDGNAVHKYCVSGTHTTSVLWRCVWVARYFKMHYVPAADAHRI